MSGRVSLVGAGPGDPSLLTVRARDLIAACDVVAHDELIADALLATIPAHVELVSVGRRASGARSDEYRLHPRVLELARAGKHVVRLKAGDPLLFGRGGEEAEELRAANIAYEIVPGISAALGAAAYAAIPLTHRLHAGDVTFATGHELAHDDAAALTDWSVVARGRGTLVLFMAAKKLAENARRLIELGRDAQTPAAYVAAATTARQRVIVAPLGDLADRVKRDETVDPTHPTLIIVGDVVALRATIAWLETRPLHGRRVLVTRARPGRSQIADALASLGAEVLEAPRLLVAPPSSFAPLDRALGLDHAAENERAAGPAPAHHDRVAALAFACAEGAEAAIARLLALGRDVRALPRLPIIAVGERAAEALRARGLLADVVARGACRDALAERPELTRGRLLVVAGEAARPRLVSELAELGAEVTLVAAYRLKANVPPLNWHDFDLVIAPSSTAAQHFAGDEFRALRAQRWLAIGPHAAAAVRALGAASVHVAPRDDVGSVVAAATELLA